jgi:hypothetical protein
VEEWLAVGIAGGLGGFMSTLLPSGTEFPWPKALRRFFDNDHIFGLFGHFTRNTILGAVASFVVWGLANPGLDFNSDSVTVGIFAAGIIAGGGGVSALNNLFQQSVRIDSKDRAIQAARTLLESDTEDSNGQG